MACGESRGLMPKIPFLRSWTASPAGVAHTPESSVPSTIPPNAPGDVRGALHDVLRSGQWHNQASEIVRDILSNETGRVEFYSPRLKTQVVDIYGVTGRGLRYSKEGDFIGFLEPRR
jgi:hypothetical protein